jgi:hypothetical protein
MAKNVFFVCAAGAFASALAAPAWSQEAQRERAGSDAGGTTSGNANDIVVTGSRITSAGFEARRRLPSSGPTS